MLIFDEAWECWCLGMLMLDVGELLFGEEYCCVIVFNKEHCSWMDEMKVLAVMLVRLLVN